MVQLYGPLVCRWCQRAGLPAADTEDVVQEVFLTVVRRVGEFRRDQPGGTFRGWLWRIAHHKLGDWLRLQDRQRTLLRGEAAEQRLQQVTASLDDQPDLASEAAEASALYHQALRLIREEFTERCWQAFWRVAVQGEKPEDVAAALGTTRNAVYVAKSRVLRRLYEVLGEA